MVELEADDALAAAAVVAAADPAVDRVLICTPDKDLAQCVTDPRVVQLDRRSGQLLDEAGGAREVRGRPGARSPIGSRSSATAPTGFPGLPGLGREVGRGGARPLRAPRGDPRGGGSLGRRGARRPKLAATLGLASATSRCCSATSPPCAPTPSSAGWTSGDGAGPPTTSRIGAGGSAWTDWRSACAASRTAGLAGLGAGVGASAAPVGGRVGAGPLAVKVWVAAPPSDQDWKS